MKSLARNVLCLIALLYPSLSSAQVLISSLTRSSIYEGCGRIKGCLGDRVGCVVKRSCHILITFGKTTDPNYFKVQLMGEIESRGYVAMALSLDKNMGHDSVVACTFDKSKSFNISWSWNFGNENEPVDEISCNSGNELKDCYATVIASGGKNHLICSFLHKGFVMIRGYSFSPGNTKYFLLAATGPVHRYRKLEEHDDMIVSPHQIQFGSTKSLDTEVHLLVRLHGSLMLIAWMVLLPNGMFFARYFKETFIKRVRCHRRLWWSVHMSLMMLGITCVLAAVVCILRFSLSIKGRVPYRTMSVEHAEIGGTASLALLLQVFIGWLQPEEREARKVFAYVHWTIGTLTYYLGLVNVLYAHRLEEASMPSYTGLCVIGWIVWNLGCHIAMAFHFHSLDKKLKLATGRGFNPLPLHATYRREAPDSWVRLSIFGLNAAGSITVTAVLIIGLLKNPANSGCNGFYCG